jgi:hypothetical protein
MGHADWLNDMMEFDHVVMVRADGTVTGGPPGVHAPESVIETDADGQVLASHEQEWRESLRRQEWEVFTDGYSGQYGYAGPVMHSSEYIGGHLAEDIARAPGLYAAVLVDCADGEPAGWAVVFRRVPFREPGYFDCPCCGETVITADGTSLVCDDCELAGCESSWDSSSDLGFWNCQREPEMDDETRDMMYPHDEAPALDPPWWADR